MRWYFSRPTSDSDTAFEQAVFEQFAPLNLENPNSELHRTGYASHGIDYLLIALSILPTYDGCICTKLPNGLWSAGVVREVGWFLKNHRMVFELFPVVQDGGWHFHLERLTAINLARACTIEQTRALVHYYQKRPDGGRSSPEDWIGPTWSELDVLKVAKPLMF
jgi:hypothetical protein